MLSINTQELKTQETEELKKILQNPEVDTSSRLGGLLKLIVKKRKTIAQKAQELISTLSRYN